MTESRMAMNMFGKKKKGTPAAGVGTAPTGTVQEEPVEFQEIPGAPAAASPPEETTVPSQVGSAQALVATRALGGVAPAPRRAPVATTPTRAARPAPKPRKAAARPRKAAAKRKPVRKGSKLTKKQLAQRKYAAQMRSVRKRAGKASGGKGRIAKRSGATKLRRQLGLKAGKKGGRKKR